jgi:hypothetical protein
MRQLVLQKHRLKRAAYQNKNKNAVQYAKMDKTRHALK